MTFIYTFWVNSKNMWEYCFPAVSMYARSVRSAISLCIHTSNIGLIHAEILLALPSLYGSNKKIFFFLFASFTIQSSSLTSLFLLLIFISIRRSVDSNIHACAYEKVFFANVVGSMICFFPGGHFKWRLDCFAD